MLFSECRWRGWAAYAASAPDTRPGHRFDTQIVARISYNRLSRSLGVPVITISQLVQRSDLGLAILAGSEGSERVITWAHAVDLPDPWHWVKQGDLVMTTGAGLPADPDEQADWITQLVDSNTSGLVLAPRPDAPELSEIALRLADERRFPVLGASFELKFTSLARVVAESALEVQRHQLSRSERLFSVYATSLREGGSLAARLHSLGARFAWDLEVQAETGNLLATSGRTKEVMENEPEPVRVPIPGRTAATLLVRPRDPNTVENITDPLLVHFLSSLLGVELDREAIERDHDRAAGEELLSGIVEGSVDYATARATFERRGLTGSLVTAVLHPAGLGGWQPADLHHLPALREHNPPMLEFGQTIVMVLPDHDALIDTVLEALGTASHAGVSAVLNATTGLIESIRQARLAVAQALETNRPRVTYAATRPVSLLPDSVAEAAALADRYLGALLERDQSRGTELTATLAAFLANDGSWKKTAEQLHIHRQTLVHRLKTVEQLTGLKPTSTVGTASLWLALESARAAGIISGCHGEAGE